MPLVSTLAARLPAGEPAAAGIAEPSPAARLLLSERSAPGGKVHFGLLTALTGVHQVGVRAWRRSDAIADHQRCPDLICSARRVLTMLGLRPAWRGIRNATSRSKVGVTLSAECAGRPAAASCPA